MVQNEFTFTSADKKTPIHAIEWIPETSPRAILQISHGISEHILRYKPFAQYITDHEIAVVGHDHLGHGNSLSNETIPLYFGSKGSWQWAVSDLETRRNIALHRFPGIPIFLLGHSMGSFLARTYLIAYPGSVNGAILMGTGQMPAVKIAGGLAVAELEAKRLGETHSSPLINQIAFNSYNKKFAPNRTAFDWLSANSENVDQYIADPLCGGNATIGLFREMLHGIKINQNYKNLKKMNLNTPVLFISGEDDPVGNQSKGVKQAFNSFRNAGVRDVSLQLFPHMRHEILNEKQREIVFKEILFWLESHLSDTL